MLGMFNRRVCACFAIPTTAAILAYKMTLQIVVLKCIFTPYPIKDIKSTTSAVVFHVCPDTSLIEVPWCHQDSFVSIDFERIIPKRMSALCLEEAMTFHMER